MSYYASVQQVDFGFVLSLVVVFASAVIFVVCFVLFRFAFYVRQSCMHWTVIWRAAIHITGFRMPSVCLANERKKWFVFD